MSEFTQLVIDDEGYASPKRLAEQFHTTIKDIGILTGLSVDIVSKKARTQTIPAQKRLQEMIQIINRVTPWCGNVFQAYAWYRSAPLVGFGLTAEELVKRGMADAVMQDLARSAEGGYD